MESESDSDATICEEYEEVNLIQEQYKSKYTGVEFLVNEIREKICDHLNRKVCMHVREMNDILWKLKELKTNETVKDSYIIDRLRRQLEKIIIDSKLNSSKEITFPDKYIPFNNLGENFSSQNVLNVSDYNVDSGFNSFISTENSSFVREAGESCGFKKRSTLEFSQEKCSKVKKNSTDKKIEIKSVEFGFSNILLKDKFRHNFEGYKDNEKNINKKESVEEKLNKNENFLEENSIKQIKRNDLSKNKSTNEEIIREESTNESKQSTVITEKELEKKNKILEKDKKGFLWNDYSQEYTKRTIKILEDFLLNFYKKLKECKLEDPNENGKEISKQMNISLDRIYLTLDEKTSPQELQIKENIESKRWINLSVLASISELKIYKNEDEEKQEVDLTKQVSRNEPNKHKNWFYYYNMYKKNNLLE